LIKELFTSYFVWVPIVFMHYAAYAYVSVQNNSSKLWKWTILLFILGSLGQYWVLVSRYSRSLVFDALLYDVILMLSFYSVVFFLGSGKSFSYIQWFGLSLVFFGLFLIKAPWKI